MVSINLVDLNKLTIKYIEKIAKECSITLNKTSKKADKIKEILNANISNDKLTSFMKNIYQNINHQKLIKKQNQLNIHHRR